MDMLTCFFSIDGKDSMGVPRSLRTEWSINYASKPDQCFLSHDREVDEGAELQKCRRCVA